jgi:hypothetical protein
VARLGEQAQKKMPYLFVSGDVHPPPATDDVEAALQNESGQDVEKVRWGHPSQPWAKAIISP